MKITYEILIWAGSQCPDIDLCYFDLSEAQKALKTLKENVAIAKEYRKSNPKDDGLPYASIKRWNEDTRDFIEYGDGKGFERDFSELPKYIQKKCAGLIAFDISIDRTI